MNTGCAQHTHKHIVYMEIRLQGLEEPHRADMPRPFYLVANDGMNPIHKATNILITHHHGAHGGGGGGGDASSHHHHCHHPANFRLIRI